MAAKINVTSKSRKSSPALTRKGKKMESSAQVNNGDAVRVIPSAATTKVILLSDLVAETHWNVRSGDFTKVEKGPDGESWQAFCKSIEANGQDTPIIVRPHPKQTGKYELAAGFRRRQAMLDIAARGGTVPNIPGWLASKPSIRAEIKNLSDAEMRFANLRENTDRENLKAADLGYGFHELGKLNAKTGGDMAVQFGLSQPYVSRLKKIWDVMPKVAELWRAANNPLPVNVVYGLANNETLNDTQRMNEYVTLIAARKGRSGGGRAADAWVKGACNAAGGVGRIVGALDHAGLITAASGNRLKFDEEALRAAGVKMKNEGDDGYSDDAVKEVVKAAQDAYKEAVKGPKAPAN